MGDATSAHVEHPPPESEASWLFISAVIGSFFGIVSQIILTHQIGANE